MNKERVKNIGFEVNEKQYKEKRKTSATECRHTKPKTKFSRRKMYHTKKLDRVEKNALKFTFALSERC